MTFGLLALCAGCAGAGRLSPAIGPAASAAAAGPLREIRNGITVRLQWMHNFGYCGETSLISAGLHYGQYVSQYDARRIAHPAIAQNLKGSELLLTQNALTVARGMHLSAVGWDGSDRSSAAFLAWVKQMTERGYPVAIGVYLNENYFYGSSDPRAGDAQYDHIVPVLAVRTHHAVTDPRYYPDDALVFSDNGLNDPASAPGPRPGKWRPLLWYQYAYAFGAFARTRSQANRPAAPVYSLPLTGPSPLPADYGVAVTGVADPQGETLPVSLQTSKYYEWPPIGKRSSVRPRSEELVLTVTVSGLQVGRAYTLYRYDRFDRVPDADFNRHSGSASAQWSIRLRSGSTYTLQQRIRSDQMAIYRAVPSDGP